MSKAVSKDRKVGPHLLRAEPEMTPWAPQGNGDRVALGEVVLGLLISCKADYSKESDQLRILTRYMACLTRLGFEPEALQQALDDASICLQDREW